MFTCIYCLKGKPDVKPSKAHVFPDAIGGVSYSIISVCKRCNNLINAKVENSVIEKSAFFRDLWDIRNRRGQLPRVTGEAQYDGFEQFVSMKEGKLMTPIVIQEMDEAGRKTYRVVGPEEVSRVKRDEIAQRKPAIRWENVNHTETPLLDFE